MTKSESAKALEMARDKDQNLDDVDDSILDGLYLPTFAAPVHTTLKVIAKSMRWHVICLNGSVDQHELDNFVSAARRKVVIVG